MDQYSIEQFQRVKRYRATKKPWNSRAFSVTEATGGFEPPNEGFADPCLTTWRRRQISRISVIKPSGGLGAFRVVPLPGPFSNRGAIIKNSASLSIVGPFFRRLRRLK